MSAVDLSILIVSWNTRDLLRACLASIPAGATGLRVETWVVDNASEDGSADMVADEFPEVQLIRNSGNPGFSVANNQALDQAQGEFVLLLNPDTEVAPGALGRSVEAARASGGPVAARLVNPDGTLQYSCFRFPSVPVDLLEALYLHRLLPRGVRGRMLLGGYWPHDEPRVVDWALGAFLLVPRTAIERAGPLPEEYPLFGEDMAWCRRLADAGYPLRYLPDAEVVHHGNQSAGQNPPAWRVRRTHAAKRIYLRRYGGAFGGLVSRWIDILGYTVRASAFTLLGPLGARYRDLGSRYRFILREVLASGHASLRPDR